MSVAEEVKPPRIFGRITRQSMEGNVELARHVMRIVKLACERRKHGLTLGDVTNGMIDGRFMLWGVMGPKATLEAVAVSEVSNGVFEIRIVGPEIGSFEDFMPKFEGIARDEGCKKIAIMGPYIFTKYIPETWERTEVTHRFEKTLEPTGQA